MPVTSTPIASTARPAAAARPGGCAILLGKVGMWLAVLSFGSIFWAVNGGFSVIGLGVLASAFNSAGALFWAAVSSWRFAVPVIVPGLPTTQPLIPWIGVLAASCLQISVVWLRLSDQTIPRPLLLVAVLLSIYDYVTTFYGLSTVAWLEKGGPIPAALLAIPMTFTIEIAIGYALKRR
jgi:hypothetical protein